MIKLCSKFTADPSEVHTNFNQTLFQKLISNLTILIHFQKKF
uniref:Uncharacterized protein n=1 Tax=Clostridium botulinum TaxID=1491 RepID=A0A126JJA1_CLOBO|nr:hypothetical protein [Clostridium botulinum]